MEILSEIVGKNLTALRKAKGMTQMQLAEEIHYSDKSISKWENGYALPTVDILLDLAAYYGVTVDYLCKEQSEENIAVVIDEHNAKKERTAIKQHRIIIMAITAFTIILAAGLILISDFINNIYGSHGHYWLVMVWAAAFTLMVEAVMTRFFFNKRWLVFAFASASMWVLIIAFLLHYQIWIGRDVWYVILAGIPIQAIFVLFFLWKKINKKEK